MLMSPVLPSFSRSHNHPYSKSLSQSTTRMNKLKMKLMIKRKTLIKGDEDDGDHEGSRKRLSHSIVYQTIQKDHTVDNILGDIKKGVTTRSRIANFCKRYSFVSSMKPFMVEDTLQDLDWLVAMQEELNNFKRNQVWSLVERPKQNVVGTKWVFCNKHDEQGVVTRNKARLVSKGYFGAVVSRFFNSWKLASQADVHSYFLSFSRNMAIGLLIFENPLINLR
jgi:hypothetical protein